MIKNFFILLLLAFTVTASRAQTPDTVWHLVNSALPVNLSAMTWTTTDTGYFLTQQSDHFLTLTSNGGVMFSTSKFPDSVVKVNGGTSHYLTFENITGGMSWPEPAVGFISGRTSSDSLSARPTILYTTNAGTNWREFYAADTTASFASIEFPRAKVGYATASLEDLTYAIMLSMDTGKTWTRVFHTDTLSFLEQAHTISCIDAKNGIIFAQGPTSNHILYTTDQGSSFQLVSAPAGSTPPYLRWNTDGSWLFAIDSSIYRSVDSGQHWSTVVAPDTMGAFATVAIHDSVGFAFRNNSSATGSVPVVLTTRDYGVTWQRGTLPRISTDSLIPLSASMPSDSEAYLIATDPFTSTDVLLNIAIHSHSSSGNPGSVALATGASNAFSASTNGNEIVFTAPIAPEQRTIQIMDMLGRICASVPLSSGANEGSIPASELRAGGYFARLGNQVVKFTVWN